MGFFVGIATVATEGSVLLVGDRKYVVAREYMNSIQGSFPQRRRCPQTRSWLSLLGRNIDDGHVSADSARRLNIMSLRVLTRRQPCLRPSCLAAWRTMFRCLAAGPKPDGLRHAAQTSGR